MWITGVMSRKTRSNAKFSVSENAFIIKNWLQDYLRLSFFVEIAEFNLCKNKNFAIFFIFRPKWKKSSISGQNTDQYCVSTSISVLNTLFYY